MDSDVGYWEANMFFLPFLGRAIRTPNLITFDEILVLGRLIPNQGFWFVKTKSSLSFFIFEDAMFMFLLLVCLLE